MTTELDKLLNTINEAEMLQIMSVGNGGETAIFKNKSEEEQYLQGNLNISSVRMENGKLTLSEAEVPGLGTAIQVMGGKPQFIKGPNSPITFPLNWLRVYKTVGLTSTDFALRLYLEHNVWYYNYIPFTNAKIAAFFGISEQSVMTSVNKFRSCGILEKVPAKLQIPEVSKRGTWYRISTDFMWLGPVSKMEIPPTGYKIVRRNFTPEKPTLRDSYLQMLKTGRLGD